MLDWTEMTNMLAPYSGYNTLIICYHTSYAIMRTDIVTLMLSFTSDMG